MTFFGRQTDDQHPDGIYFEFDDQIHGAVNCVRKIVVAARHVEFGLQDHTKIVVRCGVEASQWGRFLSGIQEVFGEETLERM